MIRQARRIVDAATKARQRGGMPDLTIDGSTPQPIDAYKQAAEELTAAEDALKDKRYDTADRHLRGYRTGDTGDRRGLALPMVFRAAGQWPHGLLHQKRR